MNFFRQVKPRSKGEWFIVFLSLILVVTTALLGYKHSKGTGTLANETVKLEAINPPVEETDESGETSPRDNKNPSNSSLADFSLEKIRDFHFQSFFENIISNRLSSFLPGYENLTKQIRLEDMQAWLNNHAADIEVDIEALQGEDISNVEMPGGLDFTAPPPLAPQVPVVPEVPLVPPTAPGETARPTSPPPGSHQTSGDESARPTSPPPGNYSDNTGGTGPTSPPPGNYSDNTGGTGPTSPPPGSYSDNTGGTGPTSPPPGSQIPGTPQTPHDPSSESPAPAPGVIPSAAEISAMQSSVLQMINAQRAAAGLSSLSHDSTLQAIASQRAYELSLYYHPGHLRPDGSFALSWISANYGNQYAQGENIARYDRLSRMNANFIFSTFNNSGKGHREIMMNPNITKGAIGIYCVNGPVPDIDTGEMVNVGGRFFVSMNFGY